LKRTTAKARLRRCGGGFGGPALLGICVRHSGRWQHLKASASSGSL
jgi:hypothetical protein